MTQRLPAEEDPEQRRAQRRVQAKIREAHQRVRHATTFLLVWDRMLTEQDRQNLGGDRDACFKRFGNTVAMWAWLKGVSQERAAIYLAYHTRQMSELDYHWLDAEISKTDPTLSASQRQSPRPQTDEEDPEEIVRQAKHDHMLVLVEGQGYHRLYWRRKAIRGDWGRHPMTWDLLRQLAAKGKQGGVVSWDEIADGRNTKIITHRRSRLKQLLPEDLDILIQSGNDPGSYLLKLEPSEIFLYEMPVGGFLWDG